MENNTPEYHIIEPQLQADGKQAWLDTNKVPLHDSKGNVVGILGTYEDITERKEAERALQIAEERYRTIFENSAVAITMADEKERLISWNKFTEKLLGMTKEDLHLKPIQSLYPEGEWEKIRTHEVRQKGMQHHLETQMVKKDGEIIDVDVSLSVLKDPEGRVTGSIGVIRDITERKEADKKIKEAMDLKSQFISTVSHELRTPLTIIKEDIALIMDGAAGRVKSKQRQILEIAQRNIDRLARLINDVLDFQKLQSGRAKFNMQDNSINNVIETVYNTMAKTVKKNGVDFRLALDNTLPKVTFDSDKMIQVLTNLVSNAMKFTEKGSITIATRRIENAIRVSVSDTGCGIKQEDLPKLFQQFQQLSSGGNRKTGGTGLGLAISKDIVEKHGGRVWVESEFGKGTTFHFLLPIKSAVREPEPDFINCSNNNRTSISNTTGKSTQLICRENKTVINELLFTGLYATQCLFAFQRVGNFFFQLGKIKRLGDVIDDAERGGRGNIVHLAGGGHHYHRYVLQLRVLAQMLQRLVAVHHRHTRIQQDKVGFLARRLLQPLFAVDSHYRLIVAPLQVLLDCADVIRLIIHDEYLRLA